MNKMKKIEMLLDEIIIIVGVIGCGYFLYLSFVLSWRYSAFVMAFAVLFCIGEIGLHNIRRIWQNKDDEEDVDDKQRTEMDLRELIIKAGGVEPAVDIIEGQLLTDSNSWENITFNECSEIYRTASSESRLRKMTLKQMIKKGGTFKEWREIYEKVYFEQATQSRELPENYNDECPTNIISPYSITELDEFQKAAFSGMIKAGMVDDWLSVCNEVSYENELGKFAREQLQKSVVLKQ
jgi:hypothetical protein